MIHQESNTQLANQGYIDSLIFKHCQTV